MSTIKILRASTKDALMLTGIAFRSKAHWGYPAAWFSGWTDDLTITEAFIADNIVMVAWQDRLAIGFFSFQFSEGESEASIEHFFVEPDFLRRGVGGKLMKEVFFLCQKYGIEILTVISDPNAVRFYEHYGFAEISRIDSSIEGRQLPVLAQEFGKKPTLPSKSR